MGLSTIVYAFLFDIFIFNAKIYSFEYIAVFYILAFTVWAIVDKIYEIKYDEVSKEIIALTFSFAIGLQQVITASNVR